MRPPRPVASLVAQAVVDGGESRGGVEAQRRHVCLAQPGFVRVLVGDEIAEPHAPPLRSETARQHTAVLVTVALQAALEGFVAAASLHVEHVGEALLVHFGAVARNLLPDRLQPEVHRVAILRVADAQVVRDAPRCLRRLPEDQVLGLKTNIALWVSQLTVHTAQLVRHFEHLLVQLVLGVGARLPRLALLELFRRCVARGELLRVALVEGALPTLHAPHSREVLLDAIAGRRMYSGFHAPAAAQQDEAQHGEPRADASHNGADGRGRGRRRGRRGRGQQLGVGAEGGGAVPHLHRAGGRRRRGGGARRVCARPELGA
mmetsp:Transcript_19317/g.63118  ORF Transcript_19317/g.63118 Transcript_19317/m.63118 type:complete len:318 (-) Transcript_19317:1384-2337(-)